VRADFSHPFLMFLRDYARRSTLLRKLKTIITNRRMNYEEAFDKAMLSRISDGNMVWDIGANLGHYTRKFAAAVGPAGLVIAFEPSPSVYNELRQMASGLNNIVCINNAVADFNGESEFLVAPEMLSALGRLKSISAEESGNTISVPVITGDSYIAQHPRHAPHWIKIDVEGFEFEVVRGLSNYIAGNKLQGLFVIVCRSSLHVA
jgi:FkbM family methyltransferase